MTDPSPRPKPEHRPTPPLLKWTAIGAIFFSGVLFFSSANELAILIKLEAAKEALSEQPASGGPYAQLVQAGSLYELTLLGSMRPLRIALAALLCFTSMTALNAAVRLLRPSGIPREGMRKLLAQTALATAALRTVDGAQAAVTAQKVGLRIQELMPTVKDKTLSPEALHAAQQVLPGAMVASSVLFTALMAGAFLQLWHYLSSERFKKMLAELEASRP